MISDSLAPSAKRQDDYLQLAGRNLDASVPEQAHVMAPVFVAVGVKAIVLVVSEIPLPVVVR